MANPFDVQVVNPLQALLVGQQSYDSAKKTAQEDATKSALASLFGGGSNGVAGVSGTAGTASQPDYSTAIRGLVATGNLDGATKVATIAKTLQPENSADIQAFKLAQTQGFGGSLLDFLKQKAEAGATRINNTTNVATGEKAYDTAVGKDYGETFAGIQKAGRDSVGSINNLNLMEGLIKNPNFYSGTGGSLVTQAKKAAASLGITDIDSAAPNEVFQKVSQKSVLDAAGGSLGTGFSNADRDYLNGTVANINNTPEGNRQIIQIAKTVEQRKQQVAQVARDYAKAHGGRIDAGFDDYLQNWANKNPAFPQSQPAQGAQPQAQAQPQAPAQAQPRQAPDGKFYVPDPNRPGKYLQVVQ